MGDRDILVDGRTCSAGARWDATPRPVQYIPGPPELLFGVDEVVGTSAETLGRMTLNPLMYTADGVSPGALGVFADTAIGSAAVAYRPSGGWAATTELTMDFCAPIPAAGGFLHACGRTAHRYATGAVATGTITDDTGSTVAVVTERVQFSTAAPRPRELPAGRSATPAGEGLAQRLGLRDAGAGLELDVVDPVINPGGSLHGGVALYASDRAAGQAIAGRAPGLETAMMNAVYLRPGPAGQTVRFDVDIEYIGRSSALAVVRSTRTDGKVCTVVTITYRRRRNDSVRRG